MKTTCHFVPLVLAGLALSTTLSGCFLAHEIGGGTGRCRTPPSMVCCLGGRALPRVASDCPFTCARGELVPASSCIGSLDGGAVDAGRRPDAGAPRDSGVTLMCEPHRANAACLSNGVTIPPLTPTELPVYFEGCGCCTEGECVVDVEERTRTLRLTTTLCPDPCDCDTCAPPVITCSLPPLATGEWTVINNGAEAFDLVAAVPPPGLPRDACTTFAAPDDECSLRETIVQTPTRPDRLCVVPTFGVGSPSVELTFGCSDCGDLAGTCVLTTHERLTDDLPAGGELYLDEVSLHRTECDVDCPDVCIERTQRCVVPALLPGGVYRVWSDGVVIATFTQGSSETVCGSLPVPG